jgi:predicted transport protein
LATSGKSLKLYLNLDFNEVESRLKCKDVSDRKCYQEVPTLLRIKSPRAMRNAKYLIDIVAKKYNLVENKKFKPVDCEQLLKDYLNN